MDAEAGEPGRPKEALVWPFILGTTAPHARMSDRPRRDERALRADGAELACVMC